MKANGKIVNCNICDNEVYKSLSKLKKWNKFYCSYQCRIIGFNKDKVVWNKGTKGICKPNSGSFKKGEHRSIKTEYKAGKPRPDKRGSNSHFWKGGIANERQKDHSSYRYRTWRSSVFTRDNYTCQMCFVRGGRLEADHIKAYSLYPEYRYDINNGRTLCKPCHKLTPNYGGKIWVRSIKSN